MRISHKIKKSLVRTPKAPSGRELSSKCETEGARVYVSVALVPRRAICANAAGSFRHFLAKMPPPSRREAYYDLPVYEKTTL